MTGRRQRRTTMRGLWRRLRRDAADPSGLGLIEVLVALIMFAIGMMAIAGISLQVATQNSMSTWQTDQALAAQLVMERLHGSGYGYATAATGTDTVTVGNRTYAVNRLVTSPSPRVKNVRLTVVSPQGRTASRVFVSRIYSNRQLPASP